MYKLLIFLIPLLGLQQEKDYRKVYTKEYFENWYQNSNLTILENDTLKELQKIIDAVQKSCVEGKASHHDIVVTIELDSLGNEITKEQIKVISEKRYGINNNVKELSDSEKYLFYNAELKFLIVDSVKYYSSKDFKTIYFKPLIEQFKGKVIYIDSCYKEKFKNLNIALNKDNDDALGCYYDDQLHKSKKRYSYYLEYAPFNKYIQSMIHEECLDYSGTTFVILRPVNTIKSIALDKDFAEAAIQIEPSGSVCYYIKKEEKWIINKKRPPLVEYIL